MNRKLDSRGLSTGWKRTVQQHLAAALFGLAGTCCATTGFADPMIPPLPELPAVDPAVSEPLTASPIPSNPTPQSLVPAFPGSATAVQRPESTTVRFEKENWTMTISPGATASPAADEYRRIYESIPYRRTEYLANPGYRHDATLERLFGQLRPTVIQRTDHAERVVNPRPDVRQPYPVSQSELEQYRLWFYTGLPFPPLLSPIQ